MQISQGSSSTAERPEVLDHPHTRYAGQLLEQIVRITPAILLGMQQAIHIVENVFLIDLLAGIGFRELLQGCIGYSIAAAWFRSSSLRKHIILGYFGFLFLFSWAIDVEREALGSAIALKLHNLIYH